MFVPTPGSSNVAVLPGPATRVTPLGNPLAAVLLKPVRVVIVVPSKTLLPSGNTSMCNVTVAPPVKVKLPV
jgi:hypothetical protein